MPKHRRTELSLAGIVLMLLVVFIHTAAEWVSDYDTSALLFPAGACAHSNMT